VRNCRSTTKKGKRGPAQASTVKRARNGPLQGCLSSQSREVYRATENGLSASGRSADDDKEGLSLHRRSANTLVDEEETRGSSRNPAKKLSHGSSSRRKMLILVRGKGPEVEPTRLLHVECVAPEQQSGKREREGLGRGEKSFRQGGTAGEMRY